MLPMLLAALTAGGVTVHADVAPLQLYVSVDGEETNNGRRPSMAFRTLERARDEIRDRKVSGKLPPEGAVVEIRGGTHELSRTLELSAEDSGTPDGPIVYRAQEGTEVRLSGGREVTGWGPVTDDAILSRLPEEARGNVLQAQLDIENLGEVAAVGRRLELFFNDEPMTLARWPNEGFVKIVDITGVEPHQIHGIPGDKVGKFIYEDDRPTGWAEEKDIWLHGYWFWDWSDSFERVVSIDTEAKTIELAEPYHGYGYRKGQRYYALNVLAELDSPGEFYLDRESKALYFWPPSDIGAGRAVVSVLPSLISMNGASHVTFEGFSLEATRSTVVSVSNATQSRIDRCTIRNGGSNAVSVSGGSGSGVSRCHIYQMGERGVSINGGDRQTLTPSGNFAEDNHIHNFGRIARTYRPAVGVGGVGQRVSHNKIHDGPHNAIQLGGNDHIIEFNEVYDVCYETGDVGAFYMGRDWTTRGTVIRHNFFHDIKGPGLHGAMSVYLDDSASGITILGNVFVRAGRAMFIGGGRDNLVEGNIFVDCHPSVHVDARGLGWMKYHVEGEDATLPTRLAAMPYKTPPWSQRYPQLLTLLDDEPGAPKGNVVIRNISVGGEWTNIEAVAQPLVKLEDNMVDEDPGFVDAENLDYQLVDDSPAYEKIGFERIPFEEIGPRE